MTNHPQHPSLPSPDCTSKYKSHPRFPIFSVKITTSTSIVSPPTMISLLSLLLLSAGAYALPSSLIEPPTQNMIHDVMDVIESGMEEPGQGRAFFISFTKTKTSTSLVTATVTSTFTPFCVDGMFTECGTTTVMPTTTMAAPRRRNKNKKNKNKNKTREALLDLVDDIYRDAVVTDQFGEERDVTVLLPELARSIEIDNAEKVEVRM